MNKLPLLLCILCMFSSCHAQSSGKPLRRFNERGFASAGFDISHYDWRNADANAYLLKADKNFRTGDALLGTGLASAFVGSGALVTGALESRLSPSLRPYHAPLIISGVALNLVVMPVCFVVRDVVRRKAARHVQDAKAKLAIP